MVDQSSTTETSQESSTSQKSSDDPHDSVDSWLVPLAKERKENETDKQ